MTLSLSDLSNDSSYGSAARTLPRDKFSLILRNSAPALCLHFQILISLHIRHFILTIFNISFSLNRSSATSPHDLIQI